MGLIRTTFELITPESATEGDVAEHGWIDEKGTEYTVHEAISFLRGREPSSSRFHHGVWYTDADPDINYRTGDEVRQSYHLVTTGKRGRFTLAQERAIYEAVTRRRR